MAELASVDAHIHLTDRFGQGGLANPWVWGLRTVLGVLG